MQSPFTLHPNEAFSIAQTSAAGALTALVLYRPLRPLPSSLLFLCAVWLTAVFPDGVDFLTGLGVKFQNPHLLVEGLDFAALLATISMLVARPHWVAAIALIGQVELYRLCGWAVDADQGLSVLHLSWFGALLGIHQLLEERRSNGRASSTAPSFEQGAFLVHDLALALMAVLLATVVATYVTIRECGSADEWAYTYQAALFAKLHAFGRQPPCASALQSFWVFESEGRMFSQYTPGWPLFMAPFVVFGAAWLAAPISLGFLVMAVARLARRAASGASGRADVIGAAGPVAAFALMTSSTVLINAASRYSHIFSCACFAWAVESLAAMAARDGASPHKGERERVVAGVVLGLAASWLVATRVGDAGTLGVGLFLYFAVAAARRRLEWKPIGAATLAFALWGGLSLVILRLQLGKWFVTGYSLAQQYYDWAEVKFSFPKPNQVRWALPIGTGSYCWWPLSPAIGLAGFVAMFRPKSRGVAFMLGVGTLALLTLNYFLDLGRGWDFGYGPRYCLPAIVAMAVGGGAAFAPLWAAARRRIHDRRAWLVGGPALLTAAAAVSGAVRLAPLLYPNTYEDTHARSAVSRAIRDDHLRNAIVWVGPGSTIAEVKDLTQNYPLELYPADAIIAIDTGPEARRCVTQNYPKRRQYHASAVGGGEARLIPE